MIEFLDELRIGYFWAKVQKTEMCWLWTASLDSKGYGCFGVGGKILHAHVVAWMIETKTDPRPQFVLHRCDVRRCVRFTHLFLGNAYDNSKDMIAKGRARWVSDFRLKRS